MVKASKSYNDKPSSKIPVRSPTRLPSDRTATVHPRPQNTPSEERELSKRKCQPPVVRSRNRPQTRTSENSVEATPPRKVRQRVRSHSPDRTREFRPITPLRVNRSLSRGSEGTISRCSLEREIKVQQDSDDDSEKSSVLSLQDAYSYSSEMLLNADEKKVNAVKHILEKEPLVADIKWSLFATACYSYRYEACVDPYPPMFRLNGQKSIRALVEAMDKLPPLSVVSNLAAKDLSPPALDLLHWVLLKLDDVRMKFVPKSKIHHLLGEANMSPEPDYVFEITYRKPSNKDHKFNDAAKGKRTFFAFHGNRLDEFHTLVHRGVSCYMDLYKKCFVLSRSLQEGLRLSTPGYGLGSSRIGSKLHCVALCEVVDHADVRRPSFTNISAGVVDTFNVHKSEYVAIRYLMVFCDKTKKKPKEQAIMDYKLVILFILYIYIVTFLCFYL